MTGPTKHSDYLREDRHDRLIRELEHDPYHSKRKIPEPNVCPDCGVVFHHGRWEWGEAPADAHEHLCPACQRVHDRVPAAYLTLRGDFLAEHKQEILDMIHNYAAHERREHPLKRIMDIEDQDGETVVTFTEAHLAHGLGEALKHAYKGETEFEYTKGDTMLRVFWER